MDVVLDLLRAMRLTGGVFLEAEFTSPWCVTTRIEPMGAGLLPPGAAHVIGYHYVLEGRCQVDVEGQAPIEVRAGEIVLLPRNDRHRLGSGSRVRAVNADALLQPPAGGQLARITHGGGGDRTRILCGFLATSTPNPPIASVLPAVLTVAVDRAVAGAWIESSFRFAAQELAPGGAGSPAIVARLAELLFIEAVRMHVASTNADNGWIAGLRDPVVGRALALVHGRLSHRWTVAGLAREAGASRSAFADRFTSLLGDPPLRYLARERVRVAAERLRDSGASVAAIGVEVGYASEAAFSRAFKRAFGQSPAAWRKA